MSEKITFIMLSTSGAPVKQMTVSGVFAMIMLLFCIAGLGAVGYGAYHYYHLRQTTLNTRELELIKANQSDELVFQRKQIQAFATEINNLKSKLLALNNFENQIRMIANLEKGSENSLFGVGGSKPEDLNPKLKLTEKHSSLIREMHQQIGQLDSASSVQGNRFESLIKMLDGQKNLLASTPAVWPVNGILMSGFGRRNSSFTGSEEFHKGLDISNHQGTPVISTADGTVSFTGPQNFLGNVVMITHGHGMVTCYAHLQKILVRPGDKVKRGEKIALLGNTGKSTGPHLHYEVHLNGAPVDPKKYILN